MFNQDIKRIGFCCKYLDPDQTQKPKILKEKQQNYTEKKKAKKIWKKEKMEQRGKNEKRKKGKNWEKIIEKWEKMRKGKTLKTIRVN